MRARILKPQRKQLALAVANEIARIWKDVPIQKIVQGEGLDRDEYHSVGWPLEKNVYPVATGELSIAIDVCPNMLSLYCRLRPRGRVGEKLSQEERDLALRMGGNGFSGKLNLHEMPPFDCNFAHFQEDVIRTVRHHLLTIKHGGKYDEKDAA